LAQLPGKVQAKAERLALASLVLPATGAGLAQPPKPKATPTALAAKRRLKFLKGFP
jgi:O-acetyl-ADP-ribose deacetylase (regulator of RNase III)